MIDDGDANGFARAGLDAGGGFTGGQAVAAHIAFAHDSKRRIVLWNFVGTFQDAVLAADALIVEVLDDSGDWIFFVSEDRAPVEAAWIDAMMTGGSNSCLERGGSGPSVKRTDRAPGFIFGEAVEAMAGRHAGFATGAAIQIDIEGVLLALPGMGDWNQVTII